MYYKIIYLVAHDMHGQRADPGFFGIEHFRYCLRKRKAKMGIFPGPGKQKTGYLAETPCRTPDNLATFATTKLP